MTEEQAKVQTEEKAQVVSGDDAVIKEGKLFAVLAYIGILCIIPLLLKKDNKFAYFHGKQGLVIFIGAVAAGILNIVPVLGPIVWMLSVVVLGLLSIAGILQALMSNYWKMPVVGDIADKISL